MPEWVILEEGYAEENAPSLGNRFLVGNGYMGVRGTLEEYEADKLPAVNLAGIYDKAGDGWREPINAPNPCYAYLKVDGEIYRLPDREAKSHKMGVDYRHGIFFRETVWHTQRGNIKLWTERFASMSDVHVLGMRYRVCADFHADVELLTGIDSAVWDLNGPHLERLAMKERDNTLLVYAYTHEEDIPVAVAEKVKADFPTQIRTTVKGEKMLHRINLITKPGEEYSIEKTAVVYTGKDCKNPEAEAQRAVEAKCEEGYDALLAAHVERWEELWKHSEVTILGDESAMRAVNYSLYHLHSIAPRHTDSLSIPARGLSGQTYKGAVFWDTEMFMLDFFLMTDPATARILMKYRIDTLEGALKKAAHYGFEGAFYAWESQEGGFDACSDYNVTDVFTGRPMRTFFKDKQMHISAAVAYGILRYVEWTKDITILDEKGVRTVVECARFYYSLLLKHLNKPYYEIHDVIGPDEYHERINNNGYTNRMAKFTLESAVEVLKKAKQNGTLPKEYDAEKLCEEFEDAARKLYLPKPQQDGEKKGVIEQFDGYFTLEDASLEQVRGRLLHEKEYWGGAYGVASHTQIIKQADVVTWLNLFSEEYDVETLRENWEYYEPRTEHGSSLSAGMYAMLACKIGEPDRAYPFFLKSAMADLQAGGKEWAGLIYIGGTHPAAAGAAYMTAIRGFGGITIENGKLVCRPSLPKSIQGMQFHVFYGGQEYEVNIEGNESSVKAF
ncbi:MAG: glycoside hydrolase family 65 protein [Acetatifactor sp.]|nr:glycoside hydrolase family 65 protein [Acetatifactor sp.]